MGRKDKLFLLLWVVVYLLCLNRFYIQIKRDVYPDIVFSHHVIGVTLPMLSRTTTKDQLAAVIAHEISHIQLRHTIKHKHKMIYEYEADILSIYYLKKAGYGICGASQLWKKSIPKFLELQPESHPNYLTRAFYMDMPECKGKKLKEELITIEDAKEIFKSLRRHIVGINRYKIRLEIDYFSAYANAYAGTRFKERK